MTTPKTSPKGTKRTPQNGPGRGKTAVDSKAPPKPKASKNRHTGEPCPTLAELADGYLKHLEEIGKSPATIFSYRMDLGIAKKHFGDETPVTSLNPESVARFFDSDAVTKKKGGANKTEITVKKTQRVLRQALVWAAEKKLIETAPLP